LKKHPSRFLKNPKVMRRNAMKEKKRGKVMDVSSDEEEAVEEKVLGHVRKSTRSTPKRDYLVSCSSSSSSD
jgi:hypothetical protein